MDLQDRSGLKYSAGQALSRGQFDTKKLVLLHSGVTFAVSAVILLCDYLLGDRIGATGGLGGIGTRSVLSTIQTVLQLGQMIFLPVWEIGFLFAMLCIANGQPVGYPSLAEGLRHAGVVIRLNLLRIIVYIIVAIPLCYAATFLFEFTPWGAALMAQILQAIPESAMQDPQIIIDIFPELFAPYVVPFSVICGIVLIGGLLPLIYRFRMSDFLVMEHPERGAIIALLESRRIMRGNCIKLFRLDVSLWWFYLLEAAATAVAFGDVIAAAAGIALPMSASVGALVFYCLSQLLSIGVYYWRKCEVTVTYAMAYKSLQPPAVQTQESV